MLTFSCLVSYSVPFLSVAVAPSVAARTGEVLVIRNCVLKNMESQCGAFRFQDEMLHGCVLTCNYDGCNSAISVTLGTLTVALSAASYLLLAG